MVGSVINNLPVQIPMMLLLITSRSFSCSMMIVKTRQCWFPVELAVLLSSLTSRPRLRHVHRIAGRGDSHITFAVGSGSPTLKMNHMLLIVLLHMSLIGMTSLLSWWTSKLLLMLLLDHLSLPAVGRVVTHKFDSHDLTSALMNLQIDTDASSRSCIVTCCWSSCYA